MGSRSTPKILTIDDEIAVRRSIVNFLEDLNYEIVEAEDGKIGLERFRSENPDLVLVDLRMPEVDGLEVLATVTQEAPDTPIIVISGAGLIADVVEALRLGAWDYLLKPIQDLTMLRHAVEKALERARLIKENRQYHEHLKDQVNEKTRELVSANEELVREVTLRDEAQGKLEDSERRLDSIIRAVPDIIYRLDPSGRITFVSDAIRIYGYVPDEVLGKTIFDFVHPDDVELARHRIDERRTGDRRTKSLQLRLLNAQQESRHFEVHATGVEQDPVFLIEAEGLYDSGKGFLGSQGIARDISEKVKLEVQLQQAQKMEAMGQLAGGIAHDFNNILTAIQLNTDLLFAIIEKKGIKEPSLRSSLKLIDRASERAASLTKQLLAFSRKQVIKPEVLHLNLIFGDLTKMLHRLIGENIRVKVEMDRAPQCVFADAGQVEQILMNLALNARDAMPDGGILTFKIEKETLTSDPQLVGSGPEPGDYVVISATDTGSGMDAKVQRRIFEPFFTTKPVGKGTGLGLATVHGIVKQSGGHIEVESRPGIGTTFKIFLPAIDDGSADARNGRKEKVSSLRGTETVLLCEDDEEVRTMLAEILRTNGYTTLVASNGKEGVELADAHAATIDLLITDVIMPDMNGRTLAETLSSTRGNLKVLYISGYPKDVLAEHGMLKDGVELLGKPFKRETILVRIREVIGNAAQ